MSYNGRTRLLFTIECHFGIAPANSDVPSTTPGHRIGRYMLWCPNRGVLVINKYVVLDCLLSVGLQYVLPRAAFSLHMQFAYMRIGT